jgi:hypothetical protein
LIYSVVITEAVAVVAANAALAEAAVAVSPLAVTRVKSLAAASAVETALRV